LHSKHQFSSSSSWSSCIFLAFSVFLCIVKCAVKRESVVSVALDYGVFQFVMMVFICCVTPKNNIFIFSINERENCE
jgi:hypothetical protein